MDNYKRKRREGGNDGSCTRTNSKVCASTITKKGNCHKFAALAQQEKNKGKLGLIEDEAKQAPKGATKNKQQSKRMRKIVRKLAH